MRLLARLLVAITLAFAPLLPTVRAADPTVPPPATYLELIAQAKELAQEKSWGRAEKLYTQAFALAPDADMRRWCELWREDATWRDEVNGKRYDEKWQNRHFESYDRLEQPYRNGRSHDEFWIATLTSRAELEQNCNSPAAKEHYANVATELGTQPPSRAAAERYVAFLQRAFAEFDLSENTWFASRQALRDPLINGAKFGATADDRAWCTWKLTRLTVAEQRIDDTEHLQKIADQWDVAVAAAAGTRWEAPVRAERFLWRTKSSWDPTLPPNTPADIPALLAELDRLRTALNPTADRHQTNQLDELEVSLSFPILRIAGGSVFAPRAPVRFAYGTSGFDRLVCTLDRIPPSTRVKLRQPDWTDFDVPLDDLALAGAVPVRTWSIEIPDARHLAWKSEAIEIAPSLPAGLYALTVRGERAKDQLVSRRLFAVTSLDGKALVAPSVEGRIFVYRAADKIPVTAAKVAGWVGDKDSLATWEGTTDAEGSVKMPAQGKLHGGMVLIVDSEPVVFDEIHVYEERPLRPLFVDLYTDRPLFRPGEIAHWKAILRTRRDGRFVVPESVPDLRFSIEHGGTPLSPTAPLTLSPAGTAAGEIKLSAELPPGPVSFVVKFGTQEIATNMFAVDRYVPPAINAKIEVLGAASALGSGEPIRIRATATYYSGEPVAQAPVHFRISVMPEDSEGDSHTRRESFKTWAEELRKHPIAATTDARGIAETTLQLPTGRPDSLMIVVNANVQPDGAAEASAHALVNLNEFGYRVDPGDWTAPRWVKPGATVPFAAVIRGPLDAPAAFSGRAQLVEIRWIEMWLDEKGRPVPENELISLWASAAVEEDRRHAGWRRIHASYEEFPVTEQPVNATADGRIEAAFTLPHDGIYRVRVLPMRDWREIPATEAGYAGVFGAAEEEDEQGQRHVPHGNLSVIACGEHTTNLALAPKASTVIVEPLTEAEQPIRVLLIAPAEAKHAWLTLGGEDRIESATLPLSGRAVVHTFAKPPQFLGRGRVNVTFDTRSARDQDKLFQTRSSARRLQLMVQPVATESRPGSPASVVIAAREPTGQPAVGVDLAVGVSDQAVNALEGGHTREEPSFLEAQSVARINAYPAQQLRFEPERLHDRRHGAVRNAHDEEEVNGVAFDQLLAGYRNGDEREPPSFAMVVTKEAAIFDLPAGFAPKVVVRRHFASTAFWAPALVTDARGEARVAFSYPDNLTEWRVGAYAVGTDGNSFGAATASTRTSLPLQARLQLPRFLVNGDSAEIAATLLNRSDQARSGEASLTVEGSAHLSDEATARQSSIPIGANAEAHLSWPLQTAAPGEARFTLVAQAGNESDAMAQALSVHEDGIPQDTTALTRLAPGAARAVVSLALPATLDLARTRVYAQLSPTPATAVLDALPYLVDYPYGCTEQTMSRFLPAVIVRQTLGELGLDAEAVEQRIRRLETAEDALRRNQTAGLSRLDEVTKTSLARLEEAKNYGGFGWWPKERKADLWMTAYVVWGLGIGRASGLELPRELRDDPSYDLSGLLLNGDDGGDQAAFGFAALARDPARREYFREDELKKKFAAIYTARDQLTAYGRACLAMAAPVFGTEEQRAVLVRNLDNGVERAAGGDFGELAHWGKTEGYWRATDGAVETTALTLLALLELDPKNPLIEPAANWLLLNRRGIHWSNTRETAFAVLALTRYLHDRGGLDATGEVDVLVNGTVVQHVKFAPGALLETPLRVEAPVKFLRPGENQIELRRTAGTSPVYLVALATSWVSSREVKPAGSLVHVGREFIHQKATPTLVGTLRITPEPLGPNGTAVAGNEVMARVTIDCPSELEYVMVEVPKPAGCEPLNPLSGWDAHLVRPDDKDAADDGSDGNEAKLGRAIYREEYDDKSVFFIDHLAAGRSEIRFGMRATTRGDFRALPAKVEAMYVPEIRANSDARRLKITAAP